jgi:hypothetical protein
MLAKNSKNGPFVRERFDIIEHSQNSSFAVAKINFD